jgi:hypothetical protein
MIFFSTKFEGTAGSSDAGSCHMSADEFSAKAVLRCVYVPPVLGRVGVGLQGFGAADATAASVASMRALVENMSLVIWVSEAGGRSELDAQKEKKRKRNRYRKRKMDIQDEDEDGESRC